MRYEKRPHAAPRGPKLKQDQQQTSDAKLQALGAYYREFQGLGKSGLVALLRGTTVRTAHRMRLLLNTAKRLERGEELHPVKIEEALQHLLPILEKIVDEHKRTVTHLKLVPERKYSLDLSGGEPFAPLEKALPNEEAKAAIKAALDNLGLSDAEKRVVITELYNEQAGHAPKAPLAPELRLPDTAPALWKDRDKVRGQSPADFIAATYGKWLNAGVEVSQPYLYRIDEPLYMALKYWLKANDFPEGLKLPTKSELIARERGLVSLQEARQAGRLARAAYRHR